MTEQTPPVLTEEQIDALNSLFDLARDGRSSELTAAVDQGIPVNLTDHKGDTLLILATYNGHPELVSDLLQRGADVHRTNYRGQSALTCAAFVQDEASVRALLKAGADPDAGGQSARAVVQMFNLTEMGAILDETSVKFGESSPQPPS